MHLIRVDAPLLDRAGDLGPAELRSLEGIHLAAALALDADLGVVFACDARLLHGAEELGLEIDSPA